MVFPFSFPQVCARHVVINNSMKGDKTKQGSVYTSHTSADICKKLNQTTIIDHSKKNKREQNAII